MSLIELPSNNGKIIAVNPHHVTAVVPYEATMAGRVGVHPCCILRMAGDTTALYICAWSVEDTLAALHLARQGDYGAFCAGYAAANGENLMRAEWVQKNMRARFKEWQGVKA